MDRTIKIQQLYSELSVMENALKDFVKPRSANVRKNGRRRRPRNTFPSSSIGTTSLLSLLNWNAAICSSNAN